MCVLCEFQIDFEKHKKVSGSPYRSRLRRGFNIDHIQTSQRSESVGRLSQFHHYLVGERRPIYVYMSGARNYSNANIIHC